jgi:hypothetical protein
VGQVAAPEVTVAREGEDETNAGAFFFGYPLATLRKQTKAAVLGWALMDTYHPPVGAEWGTFNDRIVEQSWVRDLLIKYRTDVYDHISEETAMEIVVNEDWIENPLEDLKKTVDEIEDKTKIPVLRFTPKGKEGMKASHLWMMGGNHRRLAQRILLDAKTSDYEQMEEVAKSARNKWIEGGRADPAKKKEVEDLESKAADMKARIDFESLWGMKIYSRGEHRLLTGSPPRPRPEGLTESTQTSSRRRGQTRPPRCFTSSRGTWSSGTTARRRKNCCRTS